MTELTSVLPLDYFPKVWKLNHAAFQLCAYKLKPATPESEDALSVNTRGGSISVRLNTFAVPRARHKPSFRAAANQRRTDVPEVIMSGLSVRKAVYTLSLSRNSSEHLPHGIVPCHRFIRSRPSITSPYRNQLREYPITNRTSLCLGECALSPYLGTEKLWLCTHPPEHNHTVKPFTP